jgi:uncharacterized Zn-binding protein involved in type VI secretion
MPGKAAAKQGDSVIGVDTHIVMIPSPGGPVPTPIPSPFNGMIADKVSSDVLIQDMGAATQGTKATNTSPHVPAGGPFQKPPANSGTIQTGSQTVLINDKPAARMGDTVMTCNDPADAPNGSVICAGNVEFGD